MSYDCSTTDDSWKICPECSSDATFPCVGVPGTNSPASGVNPSQYGGDLDLMKKLRATDASSSDSVCSSDTGNLGWYTRSGSCGGYDSTVNNSKKMRKTHLTVGSEKAATVNGIIQGYKDWSKFALQSLHKVWGNGGYKDNDDRTQGGVFNNGVNNKNVYISETPETVVFPKGGSTKSVKQRVMVLEAHGDKYTGIVPGLSSNPPPSTKRKANLIPTCPQVTENAPKNRVGGVACTREQFGPGVYNVLCYVPKTEDTSNGGRGYVFAVWPFHYEEIYPGPPGKNTMSNSQARGDLSQALGSTQFPCYNTCDVADTPSTCPSSTGCKAKKGAENDVYSVINHEIDIEIPCNSPQLNWKKDMTWDTMNCNTWVNDIDNYTANSGAYYTQVAVKAQNGTFISEQPESSSQKDYHWYTLDWHVDNNDFTKNYVAFYFDDPFDPNSDTKYPDGTNLPNSPTGKPLYKTQRFIPTRAGRLNVGPWMGWWGYGGQTKGSTPNFDTAKVRLAQLSISPAGTGFDGFDFPQNYDQHTPHGDVECDFRDLYSVKGPGRHNPPSPVPSPGPDHHKGGLLWLWILLGVLLVLAFGVGIFLYYRKKHHLSPFAKS